MSGRRASGFRFAKDRLPRLRRATSALALAAGLAGCSSASSAAHERAKADAAPFDAAAMDASQARDAAHPPLEASLRDARVTADAGTDGAGTDACAAFGPVDAPAAPELDGGSAWLNTAAPLKLSDLRGQVVLLDFWTYGCINCLHQIPTISLLEDGFKDQPFMVIGVHSAKFANEKDAQNIQLAMEQYGVRHPVVVDDSLAIWTAYGVHAWPTAVLIDAEGRRRFNISGEYNASFMAPHIRALVEEARCAGTAGTPRNYLVSPTAGATTPLLFPTGLAPLPGGGLAISDSSHHRVVVMGGEGQVGAVYGNGTRGLVDGARTGAEFSGPQGLAVVGDTLYVADTGNNAIRAIDQTTGTVSTVAGTGVGGSGNTVAKGFVPAATTRMNSPWDLEPVAGGLAVAMAGVHQVFLFDPAGARFRVLSGSGAEGLSDGTAETCAFAQPSGVSVSADGATLYVADAESSAIRAVTLADGSCRTLVGRGLFTYGDRDGTGSQVLLQHASALETMGPDELLVADTYNSKLKSLIPSTATVTTTDYPAADLALAEPRGVARAGSTVFVADTDHHRILSHDLGTGETHVYDLGTLSPPAPPAPAPAGSD